VADELPFMATEALIVQSVRAGGDRQAAHERIRQHSLAAAQALKDGAAHNDLFERLGADVDAGLSPNDLREAGNPARYVGRAPRQVDEFLRDVVKPILAAAPAAAPDAEEPRV
jgi:adenylosuccinate lyase